MKPVVSRAFYLQTILTERIMLGVYPPGESLPPADKIMAEFGVSRSTLKRALEQISAKKLLIRRNGRSPVVCRVEAKQKKSRATCRVALVRDVVRDGIHFPFKCGPWTWSLQELLLQRLGAEGFSVVTVGFNDLAVYNGLLPLLSGIIYFGSRYLSDTHDKLGALRIPHVSVTAQCAAPPPENMVCYDFSGAAERAAIHMLLHDVKYIDVIPTPLEDERLAAFYALLEDYNFPAGNIRCMAVETLSENAAINERYREVDSALLPLGIICYSDAHAAMVLPLLLNQGLLPKKDFILIAMGRSLLLSETSGDIFISSFTSSLPELAGHAVDMLCRNLESGMAQPTYRLPLGFEIKNT